jgi:FkbH-like protein
MKIFVFRNSTIEPLFSDDNKVFSGYEDISVFPDDCDLFVWFYTIPFKQDTAILVDEIASYYNNLELVLKQIPPNKNILIFTLYDSYNATIVNGDFSMAKAIAEYNLNIIRLSEEHSNVKIIDFSRFAGKYSTDQLVDWKYYFLSKMQVNPKLAKEFKSWFQRQLQAVQLKRKKCIIIDLDNTLWGGVLGEDVIEIGGDYPGNAFLEFQKALLELSKAGVIIAVCSKNNESDVFEVWDKNSDILLKKEHISAYRINWNNKAENVNELVEELNIGFDSVVYIDDNPTERELIKQSFPMIETPDFPVQPYLLPVFVKEIISHYFEVYSLTDEDKSKTKFYKSNVERSNFKKQFIDFSEYLKSLEIEILFQKANSSNINRIAQLTQKTNQFNLTTKRYSDSQIQSFVENGAMVYCMKVKDKFGDNGITGVIIILLDALAKTATIDSLLLSCRILGKGIEEAFVIFILNKLKKDGYEKVFAAYTPTLKNEQVKNFYEKLDFELMEGKTIGEESKNYLLDLSLDLQEIKPFYKLEKD